MGRFCLTLDDFSPHSRAGLDFTVIDRCNALIKRWPEIRINLFVPAAYCRLGEDPCYLSRFPEWIQKVNQLPQKNYRINLHGFFHRRYSQRHGNSNNDEWQHLRYNEARTLIKHMIDEFNRAGLDFVETFRPPGWKCSTSAVQALQDNGVNLIAGNEEYYNKTKHVLASTKWKKYNWDMVKKCNIKSDNVVAFGHTSDWTNNYMDDQRVELINDLLESRKFDFYFIEDI